MAIFALVNDRMNSRFFHIILQKQRLVRTVAFGAAGLGAANTKKFVMLNRIDLCECAWPGIELAMAEKTPLKSIFLWHLRRFFGYQLNLATMVFCMNIRRSVAIFALDTEMDIFLMRSPDFFMTFAANLFPLMHRLLTDDLCQTVCPVMTDLTETRRPHKPLAEEPKHDDNYENCKNTPNIRRTLHKNTPLNLTSDCDDIGQKSIKKRFEDGATELW